MIAQRDGKPVALSSCEPFASGGHRLCFRHPHNEDLCIKVNKQGQAAARKRAAPFYKRLRRERSFDDNWCEYREYQQRAIVQGGTRIWDHLSRCYGWVSTDLGPGLVSDMFTDAAGRPAETLESYLKREGLDAPLQTALQQFAGYLRETLLLTKNLLPHNLLVLQRDEQLRIILIDGLGLHSVLPLARCSRRLARRAIERRLERFSLRIDWELGGQALPWRSFEKTAKTSTLFAQDA